MPRTRTREKSRRAYIRGLALLEFAASEMILNEEQNYLASAAEPSVVRVLEEPTRLQFTRDDNDDDVCVDVVVYSRRCSPSRCVPPSFPSSSSVYFFILRGASSFLLLLRSSPGNFRVVNKRESRATNEFPAAFESRPSATSNSN